MRHPRRHLPLSAMDLIRWASASNALPLAADRVPGAEGSELSQLAALGALARELAPETLASWPEPLASWARDADVVVDPSVVTAARASLKTSDGDVLALAYEQIVSGVNRRRLGTFFTPTPIVQYMLNLCNQILPTPPKNVVDPGAGVGAFTFSALAAWPKAIVTAVDVNVVTLGLLAASAAVRSAKATTTSDRIDLAPTDYLEWLQEQWASLEGPRLILGNPPYTRHQCMSEKEKDVAQAAAGDLITSRLAGLSTYFLAATIAALGPNDTACFLLPASWCETRYGREIRQWLWSARQRQVETHFFPSEVDVFPGTQVTAMVLAIGPVKHSHQPFVASYLNLLDTQPQTVTTKGRALQMNRSADCPPTFTALLRRPARQRVRATVTLGEVARIRRGVATGASEFFFITDSQRDRYQLPHEALRSALVKPAHCTAVRLDIQAHDALGAAGLPRWLVDWHRRIGQ
jgi:methylase of polypeptide subunit release factors